MPDNIPLRGAIKINEKIYLYYWMLAKEGNRDLHNNSTIITIY